MNKIIINGTNFTDEVLMNISMNESNAMIADTLAIDELIVDIYSDNESGKLFTSLMQWYNTVSHQGFRVGSYFDLSSLQYGEPIQYYQGTKLIGKFALKSVARISKYVYRLSCVSWVGIMDKIVHYGGVYSGVLMGTILRSIFTTAGLVENTDFTIANNVSNTLVSGWLPVGSCRSNMQQALFSCGASIVKDSAGVLHIQYNAPTETKVISSSDTYEGGTLEYPARATRVLVTEHEFKQTLLDQEVSLYDSGSETVDHKVVTFQNPCYSLTASGLTINESGSNYAIVTGTGTLTGKEYTHTTNIVEKLTDLYGVTNDYDVSVTDATLVTMLNSSGVSERVASYHSNAEIIGTSIVLDDQKPMDRVSLIDPYGTERIGYIKEIDANGSSVIKADLKVVTNWQPNHVGNDYNNYVIYTTDTTKIAEDPTHYKAISSGTITIPSDAVGKQARFVLFSGFQGGGGGYDGTAGGDSSDPWYDEHDNIIGYREYGDGGSGGNGGEGGTGVKTISHDVSSLASSYSASIGTGGAGGARNGGTGSLGTHTTVTISGTTYDTNNGTLNTTGIANALNGDVYGGKSQDGFEGASGGAGGEGEYYLAYLSGVNGDSITYKGVTTLGGVGGSSNYYQTGNGQATASGGGGGGASPGVQGSDGGAGTIGGIFEAEAGSGGQGADAQAPTQSGFASCGNGGFGGGGGGGAGKCVASGSYYSWGHGYPGTGGRGGYGSTGGTGANGLILLYYK